MFTMKWTFNIIYIICHDVRRLPLTIMFTVITTVTVREIIPKWLNIGEISKFTQMLSDTKNIYVMLL